MSNVKTLKEIISKYEKADEYERTLLFLAYRDLRDVFMEIDLNHLPVIEEKATCRCLFRAS
ncbi:MAG TPA: hypothetical protein VMT12_08490 [Syntrophales bacterium]|nr:hypothetical protein [Syntrophales bacterium]